jgi:magnesium chelatase accessory protein
MVDLPGHGFTRMGARGRSGIEPMAEDLSRLLETLDVAPAALIGHSAGAALALRLAQDRPVPVISINGAYAEFDGIAGTVFPFLARALAANPLTVPFFTALGSERRTARLLAGTGSAVAEADLALYHALVSDRDHVAGALAMMAQWELRALNRAMPGIDAPVLLLAGTRDRTVLPSVSEAAAGRLPRVEVALHPLGHLMHEEAPDLVAGASLEFLARALAP